MRRVPFGCSISPFILSATIKYHIKKYEKDYPESYEMLNSSLYIDDLITGSNSELKASQLSTEAVNILKGAGMNLRKLRTNSAGLKSFWINNNLINEETNGEDTLKVLGITWNTERDELKLDIVPLLNSLPDLKYTKRFVLHTAAKVFDPVGFLSPFIIRIKCLLQEIWEKGLDWDEELPNDLKEKWEKWCSELEDLGKITIGRKYFSSKITDAKPEIHIFCDSSLRAFGAIAYFRYEGEDEIRTTFIMAKSRVSPLKKLTLPRLELMGAVIGARIGKYLTNVFKNVHNIYFWTDSSIVMNWIRGSASKWKPFVANRVLEIQSVSNPANWKHCKSGDNPADLLTRGVTANVLRESQLWWHGPEWLVQPVEFWPKMNSDSLKNVEVPEIKATYQFACLIKYPPLIDLNKFSSLEKVYRITAWVKRFIANCKTSSNRKLGPLTAEEIDCAEKHWIKSVQQEHFAEEIDSLKSKGAIEKGSILYQLNPVFDDNELLCVKTRLQFSNCGKREKFPYIIAPKTRFAELLIIKCHKDVQHIGLSSTLTEARERFYIIKGRQLAKAVIKNCVVCKRYRAKAASQVEAPLPGDRVQESPPFDVTGLDFAGPLYVKGSQIKHYIMLCTCATTRAVHLELVSSLSTEHFLMAFRRFISRRGIPSTVYSDNARTFKRANVELSAMWNNIAHPTVSNFYANKKIKWKFIVERAPWWGGYWERMVQSIKSPLRKVLGKASLTPEELETILIEIEATVNSRPLTFVYNDPHEPEPLTPSHFILGKRVTSLPVTNITHKFISSRSEVLKRVNYRKKLMDHFWIRWRKEYLLNLRISLSNAKEKKDLQVGDVVIIGEEKVPRNMWKLGLISKTFLGRDNRVRSCELKVKAGQYLRRPVQLLYPLEIS